MSTKLCRRLLHSSHGIPGGMPPSWRIAATVILRNELHQVLMLRRGATAKFMPNSFVFPGGLVEPDIDAEFPAHNTNYDDSQPSIIRLGGYENDLPLRVAAARELFEEAGMLLVTDRNLRESKIVTIADDPSLAGWRQKVREDAHAFRDLFGRMKLDVDSLLPWSNWLTPGSYKRRFDTVFFKLGVRSPSIVDFCEKEMSAARWAVPSRFIRWSHTEEGGIALPPPQFYELCRIRLLHDNDSGHLIRQMSNPNKICPQVGKAHPDSNIHHCLLPGDYAFDEEKAERGTPLRILTEREANPLETDIVHRITFTTQPVTYTNLELHIRNIDKLPGRIHMFFHRPSEAEQRARILDDLLAARRDSD